MDHQNKSALDSLSELIPREDAAIALTWFADRIQALVRERDKAEDYLFGFRGSKIRYELPCCDGHVEAGLIELKAYHHGSDELISFARSLDSLATEGQS